MGALISGFQPQVDFSVIVGGFFEEHSIDPFRACRAW
jgi:hypothetical protein